MSNIREEFYSAEESSTEDFLPDPPLETRRERRARLEADIAATFASYDANPLPSGPTLAEATPPPRLSLVFSADPSDRMGQL